MNFQPPDPEDDPRDDDQRMRDAELEAHRVRFEQLSAYPKLPKRFNVWIDNDDYLQPNEDVFTAAQMRAYVDADRAQRAALSHLPPQQSAQPVAEKTPGMAVHALAGEIVAALVADDANGGYDLTAGIFGPEFSKLVRRWADAEWAELAQPVEVQPLTVSEINAAFDKHKAAICLVGSEIQHYRIAVANAIQEAHGIKPTSSEGGA